MTGALAIRCFLLATAVAAVAADGVAQGSATAGPPLLPAARQSVLQGGRFALQPGLVIHGRHPALLAHARVLAGELAALTGVRAAVVGPDATVADEPRIELRLQPHAAVDRLGLPAEGYSLAATEAAVIATAASVTGVCRATATLLQLVVVGHDAGGHLPCITVRDAPVAPYRSIMVDVARSPHSIGVLRGVVRLARLYKVRFVQLHLTDDQHFTYPFAPVTLEAGARYALRVDHVAALPRPVVIVTLDRPGAERPREISSALVPL